MRLRHASQVLIGGLVAVAVTAIGPTAWAGHTARTTPVIHSVTFSGSASSPTITIKGLHFGAMPAHHPNCHPAGQDMCGPFTGWDFGTSLYLVDKTGAHPFSAGRYRPGISELDAVSFVVSKYTSSKIILHFGNWYRRVGMPQFHYRLAARDHITVTVRGTTRSATVRY